MGFSFKKHSVPAEMTRRYELGEVSEPDAPPIALIVRHAGEANAAYWNAMFKRINDLQAKAGSGAPRLTPAQLVKSRGETIEIYAQTIVAGWENVLEDGKPAQCTPEVVLRFLSALIAPPPDGCPEVFDELRKFCENASNFRPPAVSSVDLGKG